MINKILYLNSKDFGLPDRITVCEQLLSFCDDMTEINNIIMYYCYNSLYIEPSDLICQSTKKLTKENPKP